MMHIARIVILVDERVSTDNVISSQNQVGKWRRSIERRRETARVRLSILQKLPRVTGPFVNEIESLVTAVSRRPLEDVLANGEPAAYVKPEEVEKVEEVERQVDR